MPASVPESEAPLTVTGLAVPTFLSAKVAGLLIVSGASLSGTDAGNYTLASAGGSTTADITARQITVTAVTDSKVYDGTTSSGGVPVVAAGSLGVGDTLGYSQTFDTKDVGTGKTLTAAGAVNDGNGGANYQVTLATDSTGTITPRPITVAAYWPQGKLQGFPDLPLSYQVRAGSLATGDAFSGTLVRAAGETPGLYAIGIGTLNPGVDYLMSFVSANYVIAPPALSLTRFGSARPDCEGPVAMAELMSAVDSKHLAVEKRPGWNAGCSVPAGPALPKQGGDYIPAQLVATPGGPAHRRAD